jgi:hypothetical protein
METKHSNKIINGVKVMVTAAAVTGSIGLWSTISLHAVQAASQNTGNQSSTNTASQTNSAASNLRVVNMDVPQAVSSGQPVIQQVPMNQNSSSVPAPFTRTRTS